MSSIVLMSDRRVSAISLRECGEDLVDVRAHGLKADARKQDAAGALPTCGGGGLTRLLHAQSVLPTGVHLLFIEGYRPPALQRRYFEEYSEELARSHPDWQAAAIREAAEEAQLSLGDVERLGWVYDAIGEVYGGIGECARLRLDAPIAAIGPSAIDTATGRRFARLLATPQQAAALLGWGEQGYHQAETAVRMAEQRWGIPRALPGPVYELPADGGFPGRREP